MIKTQYMHVEAATIVEILNFYFIVTIQMNFNLAIVQRILKNVLVSLVLGVRLILSNASEKILTHFTYYVLVT